MSDVKKFTSGLNTKLSESDNRAPIGWSKAPLSELTERIRKPIQGEPAHVLTISSTSGWVDQRQKWARNMAGESLNKYTHLKEGEFSYNRGNSKTFPYGCVFKLTGWETAAVPNVYHSFRVKNEKLVPDFILHSFQGGRLDSQLRIIITSSVRGNGLLNITASDFFGIELHLPLIPEQQKIAKILTSVDEVIEKTQAQIDKLKDLKTGMMQELLTKGIGHTEFKDSPVGRIPVGWEVKTMRDVCKTRQGLQIPISSRHSESADNRYIYLTIRFINTGFDPAVAQYIENPSSRVICKKDDIILARTGATGKVVTGVSGVFHNNFFMVDYQRDKIKHGYLAQYLNSPFIQTEIKNRAGTTTIPDLNHGDFYSMPMLIPSLSEQVKIATILAANDKLILIKDKKLKALIRTKKALMQDLLTGKVRVKITKETAVS